MLYTNDKQHQQTVRTAVEGKFRGKKAIKSKVTTKYPESSERELVRVTDGYMKLLNQTLKKHLPEIMNAYKKEQRADSRFDDGRDLEDKVRQELQKVAEELEKKLAVFGLDDAIRKVARLAQSRSLREWKQICRETLGINILDDYYKGDFYEEALRKWVDDNILKIKSIPNDTLGAMREIILTGFKQGQTIKDITTAIQQEYDVTKSKAKMLARDQIGTLNAQITKLQQQDAGCSKYRWSTSKDRRVRECHKALEGKIFSWDDPPEMWYKTKKAGIVYTGRRCNPGEDYMCRCCAIPVFDIDTVDVPMSENQASGTEQTQKS